MKVLEFIELPVTTWSERFGCHVGVEQAFNMTNVLEIVPNENQTKLLFKDGTETYIHLSYKKTMERIKEQTER
jgi:hypothetical protein